MRQMREMVMTHDACDPYFEEMSELMYAQALGLERRLSEMNRKERRALGAKLRKQMRQERQKTQRAKD